MRKVTTEKILYKFSELSEDAQQKAIDNLYDINVDSEWWLFTYDDAKDIGVKISEFDIGRASYAKGEFLSYAQDTMNQILANHGEVCATYKTALQFQKDYSELVEKYSDGVNKDKVAEDNEYEFDQEADELESDFLKEILEDYRAMLQREYEYLTSEEAIKETIEANDYEFTEDGKLS